jgi:UDP-N-acetylmuramyl pentapeptide phosphotransferase/UDP-N-acetylglucosamine-1-phosphate transferase
VAGVTASALVSPLVLLAYRKNLVDKPNNRKLQKNAVPVLGGVCVFMGVTNALLFSSVFFPEYVGLPKLIIAFLCITVMFVVGFYDDLMDISFRAKFASEIFIITLLWYAGFSVDSLAGLFGVYLMNPALSLLFSIVVGLGLINAINMLDGVDGLASGFSIIYFNDKPTGAVVGQQPFGGARASGTNDKAGSYLNLIRWTSPQAVKETFDAAYDYKYPFISDKD